MTETCMANWWIMAIVAAGVAIVTFILSTLYYQQRCWDMKLKHQAELEKANSDIMGVRSKLASREMRDKVMGSVPVGRLLDE